MKKKFPKTIYKYRDWANEDHKKILLNNEVFMASPKSFNDPFDCKITENYYLLDTPKKIKKYIDIKINEHKNKLISTGKDITSIKYTLKQRLQDITTYQKEYERIHLKSINENYGVLSMCSRWNSLLMWSHYSDKHKGFCIGFDELKMRKSELFHESGMVNYDNNFPEINPLYQENNIEKGYKQTYYKAKDWEYKKEYRLLKLYYPNSPTKNERIITIPEGIIKEVILGLDIEDNHRNEIIEICKERNIKIYQAYKVPFKFKLKRCKL